MASGASVVVFSTNSVRSARFEVSVRRDTVLMPLIKVVAEPREPNSDQSSVTETVK
jgi:hypothetical protein